MAASELPADWNGVRRATKFAPSCPQAEGLFLPPGSLDEDCLYLNVSTPTLRRRAIVPCWCGSTVAGSRKIRPQLRRLAARGRRRRGRDDQLPARCSWLPVASFAGVVTRWAVRQLRADGSAGRPTLGPRQHRPVRGRPVQRHDRRTVGGGLVRPRSLRLERFPRAVPPSDRTERSFRTDAVAPKRCRGLRSERRKRSGLLDQTAACSAAYRSTDLVDKFPRRRSLASSTARS